MMLLQTSSSDRFSIALKERKEAGTFRQLRTIVPTGEMEISFVDKATGRILPGNYINFASNDYLGLSTHPILKARALEFFDRYGVGCASSRLLTGNIDAYDRVEKKLALLKGAESALILSSGYQLNSTVLPSLFDRDSIVALDRFNHNSILSGVQNSKARWFRYTHNNLNEIKQGFLNEQSKEQDSQRNKWIVTESVFSMDGDITNIDELLSTAQETDSSLFVDEAHASGVFGQSGMGLMHAPGANTIIMGTFGKGLGSFGAYIACSNIVRDYLINCCPGFIYTTALPPSVLGAIDGALDIVPMMNAERQQLLERASELKNALQKMGFDTGTSQSQIIPVIVGSNSAALSLAQHLETHGIFAPAIRTPTVPIDRARVRLSLSVGHTQEHINQLISAFSAWKIGS